MMKLLSKLNFYNRLLLLVLLLLIIYYNEYNKIIISFETAGGRVQEAFYEIFKKKLIFFGLPCKCSVGPILF